MFTLRKHALHGKKIPSEHLEARRVLTWVSSNGRETTLEKLDKNHLNNIINKIKRGEIGAEKASLLKVLEDEQIYRINNEA
jgi:hypothetical protein